HLVGRRAAEHRHAQLLQVRVFAELAPEALSFSEEILRVIRLEAHVTGEARACPTRLTPSTATAVGIPRFSLLFPACGSIPVPVLDSCDKVASDAGERRRADARARGGGSPRPSAG